MLRSPSASIRDGNAALVIRSRTSSSAPPRPRTSGCRCQVTLARCASSYVLRCLRQPCVPERDTIVRSSSTRPGSSSSTAQGGRRGGLKLEWPRLVIHSRFPAWRPRERVPWRIDEANVPVAVLSGVARAPARPALRGKRAPLRRRRCARLCRLAAPAVEPEPEPEPEPELLLTPLERALELLEAAARRERRRRPAPLARAGLGSARRARRGGWPRADGARARLVADGAAPEATRQLAARVRAALEEELRLLEEERLAEEERRRAAEEAHAQVD